MWNLSGDDVQRAKEELKGRRAAIKARYNSEIKQLEAAIGDIETFERSAVKFAASFKGEEAPPDNVADPVPAETTAADSPSEPVSAEAEEAAGSEPVANEPVAAEPVAAAPVTNEKGSSRWRMRLSAADGSP